MEGRHKGPSTGARPGEGQAGSGARRPAGARPWAAPARLRPLQQPPSQQLRRLQPSDWQTEEPYGEW